jgi:DNA-binding Xre family transcriptional regulator
MKGTVITVAVNRRSNKTSSTEKLPLTPQRVPKRNIAHKVTAVRTDTIPTLCGEKSFKIYEPS